MTILLRFGNGNKVEAWDCRRIRRIQICILTRVWKGSLYMERKSVQLKQLHLGTFKPIDASQATDSEHSCKAFYVIDPVPENGAVKELHVRIR